MTGRLDRVQIDRTQELVAWTARVRTSLDRDVDVYGHFNKHFAGHSPASLRQFAEILERAK